MKDFWSVILYDNQTRSMLQTNQDWPAVSSQTKGLQTNPDGSVDVYLGPKAPASKESNWIQTAPAKAGALCCVSTARWSRGSTGRGVPVRSNLSRNSVGAAFRWLLFSDSIITNADRTSE